MFEFQKNIEVMAMQYKLAMRIGLSLNLNDMFASFFPEALSVLNCSAGYVWLYNQEEKKINCTYTYPRTSLKDALSLQDKLTGFYYSFFDLQSEKKYGHVYEENCNYYFFMIGGLGVAVLQTHRLLEKEIIEALRPLFLKLEIACKACLQYGVSETSYKEIFENSPVALFEADCSQLKTYFDQLTLKGIHSLSEYFFENKNSINIAFELLKIKNINSQTISLYDAKSKAVFLANPDKLFGENSLPLFSRLFSSIANNEKYFHSEGITYSFTGRKIDVDLTYTLLSTYGSNFEKVLFSIVDITELKRAESRLEFLATHDFLTGLPNRVLLHSMLEKSMSRTYRTNKGMALLYLDVDYFKLINDKLGHNVGDDLLMQISKNLQKAIREDDFVSRVGGDEFVVIINNINAKNEMFNIANKIREKISTHYVSGNHQFNISVSIGASYFPQKNETYIGLMRHADSALYEAKAAGRNCVKCYKPNDVASEEDGK